MPGERLAFGFKDHSGEPSSVSMNIGAVTAVSLPGLLTEVGDLRTTIGGITLGTVASEQLIAFNTRLSNVSAADVNAARERKWLVVYEDITQFFDDPVNAIPNEGFAKVFTMEVPTADFSGTHLLPNTDLANLADADIAAFVEDFETTARSPHGGNVNVVRIEAVGRNL